MVATVAAGTIMTTSMATKHIETQFVAEPLGITQSYSQNRYQQLSSELAGAIPEVKRAALLKYEPVEMSSNDSTFPYGKYNMAYSAPDHL